MKSFFPLLIFSLLFCQYVFATDKVEINTATLEQLDKITGIGPALAQRIIDARPFSSIDDLLKVKGIGEKTLQKIKDQGLAYVEGQNQQPVLTPAPTPISSSLTIDNIFISEIMPSPDGADEQNEWIKISNLNDFEVNLSGWKLKDIEGKITTYIFPENTKIPVNGFLILTRPETKISLNNDDDGLELIKPDGTIADSVKYEKARVGQSYIKINGSWEWSKNTATQKTTEVLTKKDVISSNQAKIKESIAENHTDFPVYLIAVFSAICSSIIILFLKSKLDKSNFFG